MFLEQEVKQYLPSARQTDKNGFLTLPTLFKAKHMFWLNIQFVHMPANLLYLVQGGPTLPSEFLIYFLLFSRRI